MDPIQGVVLGIIQGLTEFLPVSSSGHLVLMQHLFGITGPVLFFDVSLHVGTLCAVLIVFRGDIAMMITAAWRGAVNLLGSGDRRPEGDGDGLKLIFLIVAGSIPTALIGLGLKQAEHLFSSLPLVGAMLMMTGMLLWLTRNRDAGGTGVTGFSWARAVGVGIAQGLAVLPGLSRSGATIAAGLFLGLDRQTAARFSFLLCIPAIVGAEILSAGDLLSGEARLDTATVLGTFTAFVVGYGALKVLIRIVQQGRFYLFAPYCFAVGGVALWMGLG
ncbi:MAG: undecaprenyl-diphosphate phosphatase [Thermodesulfobacteriota bacterium]